jgi:sigma-B regulation protein RsbU (phosphoserine phosphatase)
MATILVVDDEAEARRPLAKLLKHAGYKVLCAADAYAAMASAKRFRPDLILLDVMIPPMDGLTFLMLLRDDPSGRDTPVVVLTGLADQNTAERAQQLGVKEYLVKSHYSPDDLLDAVRRHISQPQTTQS